MSPKKLTYMSIILSLSVRSLMSVSFRFVRRNNTTNTIIGNDDEKVISDMMAGADNKVHSL